MRKSLLWFSLTIAVVLLVNTAAFAHGPLICRTPGFWGTHAGTEKDRSQNITLGVLDPANTGGINVCGVQITNTDLNVADSALEALCVSPQGTQQLQLARQLTALSLNCRITGYASDCQYAYGVDAALVALYSTCNSACVSGSTAAVTTCIGLIDSVNNGLCTPVQNPDSTFTCTAPLSSCQDEPLIEDFTDPVISFEPPGPAGSSNACNAATGNSTTIL
ncbi:MAG TPA: hypothetical protein VN428_15995 [Bryobacteraceae bacterium]|nr:hypothetical protein [Bryobacteraceae bacterium]